LEETTKLKQETYLLLLLSITVKAWERTTILAKHNIQLINYSTHCNRYRDSPGISIIGWFP